MRYHNVEDEIQHKVFQALATWRETGGPRSIPIEGAHEAFARTHPGVTEDQFRKAVLTCPLLKLDGGQISLSEDVEEFRRDHPELGILIKGARHDAHSDSRGESRNSQSESGHSAISSSAQSQQKTMPRKPLNPYAQGCLVGIVLYIAAILVGMFVGDSVGDWMEVVAIVAMIIVFVRGAKKAKRTKRSSEA